VVVVALGPEEEVPLDQIGGDEGGFLGAGEGVWGVKCCSVLAHAWYYGGASRTAPTGALFFAMIYLCLICHTLKARMKTQTVKIETLAQDPNNARKHSDRNLKTIAASLKRFGQRKPIVVREGIVVAGNGTLAAAIQLGWTKIAIVNADDMTAQEAIAFAIADNRTADLAEWDYQILAEQLGDLPDIDELGWEKHETDILLNAEWKPAEKEDGEMDRPDRHRVVFHAAQWETISAAAALTGHKDIATALTEICKKCLS